MTSPAHEFTAVDMSNHLLGPTPAVLTTAVVPSGDRGQRLALTIRTPSTTLTVLLEKAELGMWVKQLARDEQRMSVSGLIVAEGPVRG